MILKIHALLLSLILQISTRCFVEEEVCSIKVFRSMGKLDMRKQQVMFKDDVLAFHTHRHADIIQTMSQQEKQTSALFDIC